MVMVVVAYMPKFPILEKNWWEISKLLITPEGICAREVR
jgi:hypothetical protein